MLNLIKGDCAEVLCSLPAESVDLTVTSPPYDNLRAYNGFTFDFERIAKELYRVTKAGGVVVWNVADATVNGSETGTSFRQALFFKDVCGFNLYDTMIWRKPNPMPSDRVRYQSSFEYMIVLSKGVPSTANILTTESKLAGKSRKKHKADSAGVRHEVAGSYTYAGEKRRSNVWDIPVGGGVKGHPAKFPGQLASDHIMSWSNAGDTVLDPFLGSGTTGRAAVMLGRNFTGIEISEEYFEIAKANIENALCGDLV